PRADANRSPHCKLCGFHRADDLCVLRGGWDRCSAFYQSQCLFALVIRRHRDCDGALCALPRRSRCVSSDATLLAARFSRWRSAGLFLWIAIWAMTAAPIAIVATLRETSVLFGAVIAVVVLKEPLRAVRIVAACLIVCGLILIRLQ